MTGSFGREQAVAKHHLSDLRRFSYGGRDADLVGVAAWKFDVQTRPDNLREAQITAYVKCAARGDAWRAFFAKYPGGRVFGTGLPLTHQAADIEVGRSLNEGEVCLVDDMR